MESKGHLSDFFSREYSDTLAQMLNKKYASFLGKKSFLVKTSSDRLGVFTEVILKNQDESFYYPVYARMKFKAQNFDKSQAAAFLIDYTDSYFEEYLCQGQETFLPIDWTDFSVDGVDFQMKGQILNLAVERLADQILNGQDLN